MIRSLHLAAACVCRALRSAREGNVLDRLKVPGLLLLLLLFVLYIETNTKSAKFETAKKFQLRKHFVEDNQHSLYDKKGKVVFIFSNQRSGSTFLGEFFNKNPALFYLYEPLYPFGFFCDGSNTRRVRAMETLAKCDFREMASLYRDAADIDHVEVDAKRCRAHNICYPNKSDALTYKYSSVCEAFRRSELTLSEGKDVRFRLEDVPRKKLTKTSTFNCSSPLEPALLSAICSSSTAVVYKVIRACDLSKLNSVYEKLNNASEVFVIHLVRDPRAIIRSVASSESFSSLVIKKVTKKLCSRMQRNIEYVDQQLKDQGGGMISSRRYLRVHYEDIAEEPLELAERIYRFLDLPLPKVVTDWLEVATTDPKLTMRVYAEKLMSESISNEERLEIQKKMHAIKVQSQSAYGTIRDSRTTAYMWREKMKFVDVMNVQTSCAYVMRRLGYKPVFSEHELTNKSYPLRDKSVV